jgi:hypothetical protein
MVATGLSLITCWQVVELQDDNKLLEQLVTSLLNEQPWHLAVSFNKILTTCQQAGNKQCEHILLTSCWNSIATSLLQLCYNLCVFTCVHSSPGTRQTYWKQAMFSWSLYRQRGQLWKQNLTIRLHHPIPYTWCNSNTRLNKHKTELLVYFYNFTNFSMLLLAVVIYLHLLA